MARAETIRVLGLDQMRKSLKSIGDGSEKKLRTTLNDVGVLVKDKTAPWVPRLTGALAGSLRLSSTQRQARVAYGSSKVPYAGWIDFGGKRRGRGGSVATRDFYKQGRLGWRTLGIHSDEIADRLDKALTELVAESGLEVTFNGR